MLSFLAKISLMLIVLSGYSYAEIRAMTLNTEWLWTPFDNKVDGSLKHLKDMSSADYLEELRFYAKHIHARNIDLVALSEIENEQVAEELVQKLNKLQAQNASSSIWRSYFKQGRDTATGQDVAIISRLPYLEGSLTHFDFPAGFIPGAGKAKKLSKLVGVQFRINRGEQTLGVITAHLLSKRNENKKKATNREKQALGLQKAIDQFRKTSDALIVMGDFNDYLGSAALTIIINDQLNTYADCQNFSENTGKSEYKRWRRHIDHLLYSGLNCRGQYKIDMQGFSDHPAIYAEFTLRPK